ncbi:MAG: ABC transporter substrate-binding protein [Dehalococcoidales bacterium]|nr:ABC transporter substrate-binding protein [Dehalococcoidales bacterium]
MKKTCLAILAVLLAGVLFLAGCITSPTTESPSVPNTAIITTPAANTTSTVQSTTTQPKTGGTLRIGSAFWPQGNLGWPPDTLFRQAGWLPPLYIEALVLLDIRGNMAPKLATQWEVADDLKSVTLKLRQDVKFHDGSDFNAEVAKWNIDQLIDAHAQFLGMYESVVIIDNYTIRINMTSYNNAVPLALSQTFMISKAAFDKNGKDWMINNPVGTGPFKFVSFVPGDVIKTVRFDNYWDKGKPYLDGVDVYSIGDGMTRAAAFEAKEVDVITQDGTKTEYDLKQKGYPVVSANNTGFMLIPDSKNADSPLANVKVRQAIDYAINRDAIVKNLGYGWWTSTYQFCAPNNPAYIKELAVRTYAVDKAKELLAEAGYSDGFTISIAANSQMVNMDLITAIQGYLAEIGIKADIKALDPGAFASLVMGGWNNGFLATGSTFFTNLNVGVNFILTQNSPFFASLDKTDELQQLWEASAQTKEYDIQLVQKMLRYIHDNAYVLPLYTLDIANVVQPYVKDCNFFDQQWSLYWHAEKAWLDK